ncbi:Ubiquinone/menaquinone biosynthesis C-methylase UbiE [Granulicatella balaenopterae]|uniref:Ubiquinone/menaquinone biosynthesis C-methylase UbiE n=2 Tax=Granulicatella balaenopterae TaxID=137733 RepID=A0A1H9NVU0_9LACT|nr:Ubiquinone/menaquinone biosynthesis C-methylase UbiE [Granulicatella balaenopterae]
MKGDKEFWNRGAKFYATFMKKNERVYENFVELIAPFLQDNLRVLEIGCATGQITFLLSSFVDEVIATDYSERMIEYANKRKSVENIIFEVADAIDLPYEDGSFDAVVIGNVLHIVSDADKVLAEAMRVLKPGGRLFALTFIDTESKNTVKLKVMKLFGFNVKREFTRESYEEYITAAGFEMLKSEVIAASPLDEGVVVARKNK